MYGGEEKCVCGFSKKTCGKDNLGGVGADGRVMNEWMVEQRWEGMDCKFLAQHMDKWWVLVNRMLNLQMLLKIVGWVSLTTSRGV